MRLFQPAGRLNAERPSVVRRNKIGREPDTHTYYLDITYGNGHGRDWTAADTFTKKDWTIANRPWCRSSTIIIWKTVNSWTPPLLSYRRRRPPKLTSDRREGSMFFSRWVDGSIGWHGLMMDRWVDVGWWIDGLHCLEEVLNFSSSMMTHVRTVLIQAYEPSMVTLCSARRTID